MIIFFVTHLSSTHINQTQLQGEDQFLIIKKLLHNTDFYACVLQTLYLKTVLLDSCTEKGKMETKAQMQQSIYST